MSRVPWVRVIIVNYNGREVLPSCLEHLAAQTMPDFEVVVVDNGSSDGSYPETPLPDPRFRWLAAGANLGFAAGNNLGARDCAAPWIATLNPDAFAQPDWLETLRAATQRHPGHAAFGLDSD